MDVSLGNDVNRGWRPINRISSVAVCCLHADSIEVRLSMHHLGSICRPARRAHIACKQFPQGATPITFLFTTLLLVCGPAAFGKPQNKPLPTFKEVSRVVGRHFATLSGHKASDLITRKDVAPIFSRLREIGWVVEDRKEILSRVPAADDFIAKQLRTNKGLRFMRSVAKYPEAYDRLDRLSRIPHGKQTIKDLVRGRDGDKMIEYMTTTSGGKNQGKMLSKDRGRKNFNRPTGKIYTAKALLIELKASHARAVQVRMVPNDPE